MKALTKIILAMAWSSAVFAQSAADTALLNEANGLAKQFGGALKAQMMGAMKSGGPQKAIAVCHKAAPEIAASIGKDSAWTLKRTSLKARKFQPDDWEIQVLKQFEVQKESGVVAQDLVFSERVNGEFRYARAIITGNKCLTCHGENIAPNIQKELARFYQHDAATGYKAGDIRGMFSFKKAL